MIVARPISCIVSDVGVPALALSPCLSCVKDLHFGPDSYNFSVITNPHLEQNISPDSLSVTNFPCAHLGHISFVLLTIHNSRVLSCFVFMNQQLFCFCFRIRLERDENTE